MSAYLHALSPTGELIPLQCDADGKLYIEGSISLDSAVLPDGAATSAKQDSVIARLPAALTSGGGVKMGLVDALPAGANSIGAVSSNSVVSAATVTRPADTTAYAAKDVISTTLGAAIEFTGMARANGGFGLLTKSRVMTNQASCVANLRLHLFHTSPTPIADNSPYVMLWANRDKRIGTIRYPALATEGSGSDAAAAMRPSYDGAYSIPDLRYQCAANDTKLYGILATDDIFTPASGQIFFIEHTADWLS